MNLWQSYLQIYSLGVNCEKSWLFISEPITTLSNVAFFIVAYLSFNILNQHVIKNKTLLLFPYFILLIGLGSSIYHLFNNPFTLIGDLLPIYIFVSFLVFILVYRLANNRLLALLAPLALVSTHLFLINSRLPHLFLSSAQVHHSLNLLTFVVLLSLLYKKFGKIILGIIPSILLYTAGIFIRSFDFLLCPLTKVGAHFMWHILVALSVYLAVKFFVRLEVYTHIHKA